MILEACKAADKDLRRMAGAHGVDRRAGPSHNRITSLLRAIKRVREMVGLAESTYAQAEENTQIIQNGIDELEVALLEQAEALQEASGHRIHHRLPEEHRRQRRGSQGSDDATWRSVTSTTNASQRRPAQKQTPHGALNPRPTNRNIASGPTSKDKAQQLLKMLHSDASAAAACSK